MTTPLSPEYLAEIAARAEAATAGPWCTDGAEIYQGDEYAWNAFWVGETCRADEADGGTVDAAFIAAARTDVPALAAEVERLRAELHYAQLKRDDNWQQAEGLRAELAARPTRDEADAEMQRATDGLREAWTSEIERLRRLHTGALAERDRYRSAWQSARYRAALTHSRRTA